MTFEIWKTPFSAVKGLGRNYALWADNVIIELFEYKQSGPPEDIEINKVKITGSYPAGLTKESWAWRLTFTNPVAMRVRHESQYLTHPERDTLPGPYCFSDDSDWLNEIRSEPLITSDTKLIHIILVLWDDFIEIITEEFPSVEEIKPTA